MGRRKQKSDGTPVLRAVESKKPPPTDAELEALEALTDGLPEVIRAFRDLKLLGPERRFRIEETLKNRTRTLTVVLHGVHDPRNQSAVLRTCEAFGVQEVHVSRAPLADFAPARSVTKAAERWLDVVHHDDFASAARTLRARGMRVLAAAIEGDARELSQLDLLAPTALVFGNEARGLPAAVREACDGTYLVPMYGFTQSLNVSVAAGVSLAAAVEARRRAWGRPGDLAPEDIAFLRRRFYLRAAGRVPASLRRRLREE